ncbi:MAG: hypothetical protein BGO43_01180 [Gammaproteobacteria bacterium 39-13]|nr:DUF2845 domain-containing protein [Gammaproteobacteria bacterium]OJV92976.1 MAG: hypothetical protein BGO43_01180 [Gammaproteobacteria bacterium 39-13]
MLQKIVSIILLLVLPNLCFASFQCKSNAVAHEGDTAAEVEIKCGQPMSISRQGKVTIKGELVDLERWVYNPGYGKFYQILEFHNGVLVSVKSGPRT